MGSKKEKEESKCIIRHFLADGTQVESMKGRIVPTTGKTKLVYMMLAGAEK